MTEDWTKAWKEVAKAFDQVNLNTFFKKAKFKKTLIVADGDLDGIVSAILVNYVFKNNLLERPEIRFTRPHLVKVFNSNALKIEDMGIITSGYDFIIIVDCAINNRDPEMSKKFIENINCPFIWIDHHYYDGDPLPANCFIRERESCVSLIRELYPDVKFPKKINELITLAHETDKGNTENIFNNSLKINLQSEEARREIYQYGIAYNGLDEETHYLARIKERSERSVMLRNNTEELIEKHRKIIGNVSVIDMREFRDKRIGFTHLYMTCYKDTPFVLIKYFSTDKEKGGEEYLKIGRSPTCRVNLLKVFNLKAGARYRITIKNERKMTATELNNPKLMKGREIMKLVDDKHGKRKIQIKGRCLYKDSELLRILENAYRKYK